MEEEMLKQDAKRRMKAWREENEEMDMPSKVAIWAGFIGLGALLWYAGAGVDAVIGLLELS